MDLLKVGGNDPCLMRARGIFWQGSIREFFSLRPIKPDKHRSARERRFRDQVMIAVRKKIASDRIPCSAIIVSGRPMLTAVRARIMRGEIDDISLSRAFLIADAVGLDLADDLVPRPAPPAPKPAPAGPTIAEVLARVIETTRAERLAKAQRRMPTRATMSGPSLFDFVA
jgi:hypothetical protein